MFEYDSKVVVLYEWILALAILVRFLFLDC